MDDLISQSIMYDQGVCRTAPATLGLLTIHRKALFHSLEDDEVAKRGGPYLVVVMKTVIRSSRRETSTTGLEKKLVCLSVCLSVVVVKV